MSEETKKCKHCQSEIPKKAKVCPVCRRKLNHPILWTLVLIIGLIMAISFYSSMWNNGVSPSDSTTSKSSDETSKEASSKQNTKSNYITLDDFNKIETGMTYEEVVNIIGYDGTVMAESEVADIKTTLYYWYGKDGVSNANITLQNDRVISKAQIGLK